MKKRPLIKICGMRDPENIMRVGGLLPDYMGFIFYHESPRFVGEQFCVPENLPSTVKQVGVFVNESTKAIVDKVKQCGLSFVQLHGDEPVSQCHELKRMGYKVIKTFGIGEHFDFSRTKEYKPAVDYFMFDTKGKYFGGNARKFDWRILRDYDQEVPFFLSGGLNQSNVEAVAGLGEMNIHAVDFNSGVESHPGMKDVDKIRVVMQTIDNLF